MNCYEIIRDHRSTYPVAMMTAAMGVSTSGFYDWIDRPPSARARRRAAVASAVREAFEESHAIYGSRKVTAELAAHAAKACRTRWRR